MSDKIPNNHQLHIMLVKLDGKLDTIISGQENAVAWQNKHEKNDKEEFDRLHQRIGGMKMYGSAIATVAAFIGVTVGAFFKSIWERIT